MMDRELRNNGGRVLQRVAGGETLTVTMDGHPIADLRPIPGRGLTAATLLQRWRRLPPVDAQQLRADLDRVLNASLWADGRVTRAASSIPISWGQSP